MPFPCYSLGDLSVELGWYHKLVSPFLRWRCEFWNEKAAGLQLPTTLHHQKKSWALQSDGLSSPPCLLNRRADTSIYVICVWGQHDHGIWLPQVLFSVYAFQRCSKSNLRAKLATGHWLQFPQREDLLSGQRLLFLRNLNHSPFLFLRAETNPG